MSGLSKLTVLFVEDEEDLRGALESAIGDEFAKFIVARDGDDGLKKFKKYVLPLPGIPKIASLYSVLSVNKFLISFFNSLENINPHNKNNNLIGIINKI